MPTLSAPLQTALLLQTACGNESLREFLEGELALCEMCQDAQCQPQLLYLRTHLCLIEAAQLFARQRIDQKQRTLVATVQEDYTSFTRRNTDSENTATGRSCRFATVTSEQNFYRNSTDDDVGFSEMNHLSTAEHTEGGFDRSTRSVVGSGAHMSRTLHTFTARKGDFLSPGAGTDIGSSQRDSSTRGGTGAFRRPTNPSVSPSLQVEDTAPYVVFYPAQGGYVKPGVPNPENECAYIEFENGDVRTDCTPNDIPSYGQSVQWSGSFTAALSFLGFSVHVSGQIHQGESFRQFFTCVNSFVSGSGSSSARMDTSSQGRTTATPDENFAYSNETSSQVHFVRKASTSTRRGTTHADAEHVSTGRGKGQAHNESEKKSKGEAYQQRRAESLTVVKGESHLRRVERVRDDEEHRAFGQISVQLGELWKRVWARYLQLSRQFAAVPFGGHMNCPCPTQPGDRCQTFRGPVCR